MIWKLDDKVVSKSNKYEKVNILNSSIHGVFLRNRLYLGHNVVTSFRVQFEKLGCGLLREAKQIEGEWAVLVEAKEDKKDYY